MINPANIVCIILSLLLSGCGSGSGKSFITIPSQNNNNGSPERIAGGLVQCSCYPDIAVSGTGLGSDGQAVREFLFLGQAFRIRQDGDIAAAKFAVNDLEGIYEVYITIWRYDGNAYDRVGESENLRPRLLQHQVNSLNLTEPIEGAIEGDLYGLRITGNGQNVFPFIGITNIPSCTTFCFNSRPPDENVDWPHDPGSINLGRNIVPVRLYMKSPDIVAIGDSLVAGHPASRSFIESANKPDYTLTFPYHVRTALGTTLQNMGVGGNTISQIRGRFNRDCVALHPSTAIINGGVNDLIHGNVDQNEFIGSWKEILDACRLNGIKAVVLGIFPYTDGSNEKMRTRDQWNAALKSLVEGYEGFIYVNSDSYIGMNRSGGDAGNLWDIKPEYDADGLHLTPLGYEKVAEAVIESMVG